MHLHMLAIVPLITGSILTIIGLSYDNFVVMLLGLLVMTWGLIIHSNNIVVVRRIIRRQE